MGPRNTTLTHQFKNIGILTDGGDCHGINAVIRSPVKTAINIGWKVYGIKEGFAGLMNV